MQKVIYLVFSAKIVADSLNPLGERLTTLEVTYPRFILAEFNTHKRFARNTASTRAIPLKTQIEAIRRHPFIPERFPKNQAGMHNTQWLTGDEELRARSNWIDACDSALHYAKTLAALDVHKQIAGRILEPFMWVTQVITSAHWDNFYDLRISEFAQPEINTIAVMMRKAMDESKPKMLGWGGWHLPYTTEADTSHQIEVSVARCAATSYNRQSTFADLAKELNRVALLRKSGHWSPFEHQGQANQLSRYNPRLSGTFYGTAWAQNRKLFPGESGEPVVDSTHA